MKRKQMELGLLENSSDRSLVCYMRTLRPRSLVWIWISSSSGLLEGSSRRKDATAIALLYAGCTEACGGGIPRQMRSKKSAAGVRVAGKLEPRPGYQLLDNS